MFGEQQQRAVLSRYVEHEAAVTRERLDVALVAAVEEDGARAVLVSGRPPVLRVDEIALGVGAGLGEAEVVDVLRVVAQRRPVVRRVGDGRSGKAALAVVVRSERVARAEDTWAGWGVGSGSARQQAEEGGERNKQQRGTSHLCDTRAKRSRVWWDLSAHSPASSENDGNNEQVE